MEGAEPEEHADAPSPGPIRHGQLRRGSAGRAVAARQKVQEYRRQRNACAVQAYDLELSDEIQPALYNRDA